MAAAKKPATKPTTKPTRPVIAPKRARVVQRVSDSPPAIAKARKRARSPELSVRRMHRRDLNRVWEFLKLVFRGVNRETVEYQRPRSKQRFTEQYDDEGVEQLVFEIA